MKIKPAFIAILPAVMMMISKNTNAQMTKHPTLNHAAVYVYDLQKSADFYKNIIGLENIPEPFHDGRHVWFRIGEHSQLHLISGAKSITEHDKDSHLCFTVASMDDFIANLHKNKVPFFDWPGQPGKITIRPDGIQQIYFKDPDGYWIEINNDTY
jgi:lactoylglutathione lyase